MNSHNNYRSFCNLLKLAIKFLPRLRNFAIVAAFASNTGRKMKRNCACGREGKRFQCFVGCSGLGYSGGLLSWHFGYGEKLLHYMEALSSFGDSSSDYISEKALMSCDNLWPIVLHSSQHLKGLFFVEKR